MIVIKGIDHFQSVCKKKLVDWYNKHCEENHLAMKIDENKVFVVWAVRVLQNYKAMLSTEVNGDGIYVECTYNGNEEELYVDVYKKLENICHTEE